MFLRKSFSREYDWIFQVIPRISSFTVSQIISNKLFSPKKFLFQASFSANGKGNQEHACSSLLRSFSGSFHASKVNLMGLRIIRYS